MKIIVFSTLKKAPQMEQTTVTDDFGDQNRTRLVFGWVAVDTS